MGEDFPRLASSESPEEEQEAVRRKIEDQFPKVKAAELVSEDLDVWRKLTTSGISQGDFNTWKSVVVRGAHPRSSRVLFMTSLVNAMMVNPATSRLEDMLVFRDKK